MVLNIKELNAIMLTLYIVYVHLENNTLPIFYKNTMREKRKNTFISTHGGVAVSLNNEPVVTVQFLPHKEIMKKR